MLFLRVYFWQRSQKYVVTIRGKKCKKLGPVTNNTYREKSRFSFAKAKSVKKLRIDKFIQKG